MRIEGTRRRERERERDGEKEGRRENKLAFIVYTQYLHTISYSVYYVKQHKDTPTQYRHTKTL